MAVDEQEDERTVSELREQAQHTKNFNGIEAAMKAGIERSKQAPQPQGIALAAKVRAELRGKP